MIGVWPPLPPAALGRRPGPMLPFPLGRSDCSLFARARHGLWQGVQALQLAPGDEVLVPAYHHGSEIEALLRAGLRCRFYDAAASLEPDAAEVEALLDGNVRALYLTHYLGFPQDAARWRSWCDERNLLLIEDAAQAWLATAGGRPVGSLGDLAVFCLYKSVGVPDGAALVVGAPPPRPESRAPAGLAGAARRQLLWAFQRVDGAGPFARGRNRNSYDPAEDFALGDPGAPPTTATTVLVPRLADERVASARRANYRVLLQELEGYVPEPFDTLPGGAAPFALPVETDDKHGLLGRLASRGIRALDFWSVPHPALPAEAFPGARRRRDRTIGVPVHQELRPEDLDLIAATVVPRRRQRPPVRVERVSAIADVHEDWDALAERTENVFATPDWADTWWHHFGAGREAMILVCRRPDGRVAGILPMYVASVRPLRILRFIGHGPADELGPICAAEDRPLVARALRRALADARADVLLAENLSGDAAWGSLVGGALLKREASPVLEFGGARSWDELRSRWSSNLRQQTGRLERKLVRESDLAYELAEDADELDRDLDDLVALHAARWGRNSAFLGGRERFHRDFAKRALARGRLRLWFLVAGGTRVAAWYGFRLGAVESFYQAGRDPTWEARSVGFVLLLHSIRSALEDGMREYRFLRGEERFKYRLANRDPGLESLAISQGPLGTAATTAGRALRGPLVPLLERRLAGRAELLSGRHDGE